MNILSTTDGILIPTDKIVELRPDGLDFIVVTSAGRYKATADAVHAITKPVRITKKVKV
jgi:hypothetical protein